MVEEDVGIVTQVLIALVTGVIGLLGGYVFGVLRTLNERRNERRDAALAEIFKEMSLFYRYLVSWTDDPNPVPNEPSALSSGIPVRTHVNEQYQKFTRTFFDNAIWLGQDTYNLIQAFVETSRVFLNELNSIRADGRLLDGTSPKDRRKEQLTPEFYKVRDALQAEVEASRNLVSWFR